MNMVCMISIVGNRCGLYDIHCLVFILEPDYMVSFYKYLCLLEKNAPVPVIGYRSLCVYFWSRLLMVVLLPSMFLLVFACLFANFSINERERSSHISLRFVALSPGVKEIFVSQEVIFLPLFLCPFVSAPPSLTSLLSHPLHSLPLPLAPQLQVLANQGRGRVF